MAQRINEQRHAIGSTVYAAHSAHSAKRSPHSRVVRIAAPSGSRPPAHRVSTESEFFSPRSLVFASRANWMYSTTTNEIVLRQMPLTSNELTPITPNLRLTPNRYGAINCYSMLQSRQCIAKHHSCFARTAYRNCTLRRLMDFTLNCIFHEIGFNDWVTFLCAVHLLTWTVLQLVICFCLNSQNWRESRGIGICPSPLANVFVHLVCA